MLSQSNFKTNYTGKMNLLVGTQTGGGVPRIQNVGKIQHKKIFQNCFGRLTGLILSAGRKTPVCNQFFTRRYFSVYRSSPKLWKIKTASRRCLAENLVPFRLVNFSRYPTRWRGNSSALTIMWLPLFPDWFTWHINSTSSLITNATPAERLNSDASGNFRLSALSLPPPAVFAGVELKHTWSFPFWHPTTSTFTH